MDTEALEGLQDVLAQQGSLKVHAHMGSINLLTCALHGKGEDMMPTQCTTVCSFGAGGPIRLACRFSTCKTSMRTAGKQGINFSSASRQQASN